MCVLRLSPLCVYTIAVDRVAIRTAMWGEDHRYWDDTAEGAANKDQVEKYFPNSRFGLNGQNMLIVVLFWQDLILREKHFLQEK